MYKVNDTPLYLGTSGYKYQDWKGKFYPSNVSNYEMLKYYNNSKLFNFLELTFTFYNFPYRDTIRSIVERASNLLFSVRLHKSFLKGRYNKQDIKDFYDGLKPMIDDGKLAAFFADFNYSFTASKENFGHILKLVRDFNDYPLFFELPNRTWYKDRFLELFREHRIGLITIDMPTIKGLAPYYPFSSNNYTYFRLYGRSGFWLTPEDKILDYSYKDEDLKKFIEDIKPLSLVSKKVFVTFCNVVDGHAVENAGTFIKYLSNG